MIMAIGVALFIGALGCALLVELHRTGYRPGRWMLLAIPPLSGLRVRLSLCAIILGYASDERVPDDFVLIHAYADDGARAVYALLRGKSDIALGYMSLRAITRPISGRLERPLPKPPKAYHGRPAPHKRRCGAIWESSRRRICIYVLPPVPRPRKTCRTNA